MANEVQVRSSLQIRKGNLQYSSQPQVFTETMVTADPKGPVPGALTVPTTGVDVSFAELTTPGWCRLINLDDTNYVEVGLKDASSSEFRPVMELPPGIGFVIKLSRNLGEEYTNTGTGTTATTFNTFHLKANGASCIVSVEAFEK